MRCAGRPESVEFAASRRVKLINCSARILTAELLYLSNVKFEGRISVVTDIDSDASSVRDIVGDMNARLSSLVHSMGYSNEYPRFGFSYSIILSVGIPVSFVCASVMGNGAATLKIANSSVIPTVNLITNKICEKNLQGV